MINFYCQCGQPMSVKPEFAGRQGNCPRCRQPFTVPQQSAPTTSVPLAPTESFRREQIPPPAAPTPPQQTAGSGPRLEVVHGPGKLKGTVHPIAPSGPTVIGRDPRADLTIPSDRISRRHCRVVASGDGAFVVEDLGSSNGTLVNQARIDGRRALTGGEFIQAGDCLFKFVAR